MSKRFRKAADGMVLTNGSVCADCVFLAQDEDEANWREVPAETAALLQEAEEADYRQALERFGVIV